MKTIAVLFSILSTVSTAHAIAPMSYECDIIELPTGTNDSWHATIYNDYISFFDNDHENLAKFTQNMDTGGGSVHRVYRSVDKNDPFRIVMEDSIDYNGARRSKIYLELYLGKQHKPTIFECKYADPKKTKAFIQEVIADQARD